MEDVAIVCIRCQDEPAQPGKMVCLLCENAETDAVLVDKAARDLARETAEKYGPAVQSVTDLGTGMP